MGYIVTLLGSEHSKLSLVRILSKSITIIYRPLTVIVVAYM